jgi:hypothetical protein
LDGDVDGAINNINNLVIGSSKKGVRVERSRGSANVKKFVLFFFFIIFRREEEREKNNEPKETLFVTGYDPSHTQVEDLVKHFEPFSFFF